MARQNRFAAGLVGVVLALSCGDATRATDQSGAEDARTILRHCLKNQEATNKVSFKVETDIVMKRPKSELHQRAEALIRRDGDLADSQGRYEYLDVAKNKSNTFRSVINAERFIQSISPLSGGKGTKPKVEAMTSLNRSKYLLRIVGVPHFGGFLDGYVGGSGNKRLVNLMLDEGTPQLLAREAVGEIPCEVVKAKTRHGTITFWIAPSEGYAVRKYQYEKGRGDLGDDEKPLGSPSPSPSDKGPSRIAEMYIADGIQVSKVGSVYVPSAGRLTILERYSDGTDINTLYISQRKDIAIQPDFQGTDAFQFEIPNDTVVFDWDHEKSGLRHVWRDGSIRPAYSQFEVNAPGFFRKSQRHVWLVAVNGALLLALIVWSVRRTVSRQAGQDSR